MDPRYRFTIVISSLLVFWWLWVVISTYLFGNTGLNGLRYQQGVGLVGLAALGGFLAVWSAYHLIKWQRQQKTGFEAEPVDEFGTAFKMTGADGKSEPFRMALSKFQPAIIAPPQANTGTDPTLHPLEAELIGFLQGYRHWPVNLNDPDTSLYEQSLARWQVARHLPNSSPWLRVVALAKDLGLIHAYTEQRTPAPWWQPFTRDAVSFKLRTAPRPGMSALLLSTMPAFRALASQEVGPDIQRAMLAALRFHTSPGQLPLNAGALAPQLVEGLMRAEANLGALDITELDKLTPARHDTLQQTLPAAWLALLGNITPHASLVPATPAYIAGGTPPTYWLHLGSFLSNLGPLLEPALRTALQLWDTPNAGQETQAPAWGHLLPLLQEANLISVQHYGVEATAGTFMLADTAAGSTPWGPALKLNLDAPSLSALKTKWQALPMGPAADLALEPTQLARRAEAQLQALDNKLRELF